MPWNGQNLSFTRTAIINSVPNLSGVYAIWRQNEWIYVGETNDLQRRLLEHLDGDNRCITGRAPTNCGFELVSSAQRVQRQNALILELSPTCNQRLG